MTECESTTNHLPTFCEVNSMNSVFSGQNYNLKKKKEYDDVNMAQWKISLYAHSTKCSGGRGACCSGTVRQLYLWLCTALPNQTVVGMLQVMHGTTTWVKSIDWKYKREREGEIKTDGQKFNDIISQVCRADPVEFYIAMRRATAVLYFLFFCSLMF